MKKQETLGLVLIGLIFVFWLIYNAPQKPVNVPQDTDSTTVIKEEVKPPVKETVPATPAEVKSASLTDSLNGDAKARIITVENDLVKLELSSEGARINRYFIKKYKTWYINELPEDAPYYKTMVQLINAQKGNGDLSQTFITRAGEKVNTADLIYTAENSGYDFKISGDDSLSLKFRFNFNETSYITKTYVIAGNDYNSKVSLGFENMQDIVAGGNYDFAWENGINFVEKNSVDEANYSNASLYAGEEHITVDATDVDEKENKATNGVVDWMAVKSKYFAIILSPENPTSDWRSVIEGEKTQDNDIGDREYYSLIYSVPFKGLKSQTDEFNIFIGPVDYDILAGYERNFEAIYNFGSFMGLEFIIRPISEYFLLPMFKLLHTFIPNYGVVILLVAFIIKLLLYPLTKKSYQSMKRMQLLQPKMAEIKEKFKDDPQRVQKETMALYSTYGVNPAGGCLPMFAQMPILIALFYLFNVAIDIRNEPFALWITNLAVPDVIAELPFRLPIFGVNSISGLAIILGLVMFIQQSMTMKDPNQKALVYIMPIMMTVLFMSFPSGVNLYYLMFNFLTILQQWLINRSSKDAELKPIDPKDRKPGFFSRLMQQAEETRKIQQKNQNKKRR